MLSPQLEDGLKISCFSSASMVCVSLESNRGVFRPVNCAKRLILRAINQSIVL